MLPEKNSRRMIGNLQKDDWIIFLDWAKKENWHIPKQELQLYQGPLSDSAFVLREGRQPLGFVTIARHERSGWIGNLIVHPLYRRQGLGKQLLEHALQTLGERGARTFWLTASRAGQSLYNRYGFAQVDKIERWTHSGPFGMTIENIPTENHDMLFRQDAEAWGESRFWLLAHLSQKGRILSSGQTVALLQEGSSRHMVGPWLTAENCPRENRLVLNQLMALVSRDSEVVIDILGSSPVKTLIAAAGFGKAGETGLMARGPRTGFRKEKLVALASLGSMG